MNFKQEKRLNRTVLIQHKLTAALLLLTLFGAVFPTYAFSGEKISTADNLVYCPLLKRWQPINPPDTRKEKDPFDFICASPKTKDFLFREIVLKTPWKSLTLDAKSFENLVFDYLAHGKSTFGKLPSAPNAPSENKAEGMTIAVVANNRDERRFAWQLSATVAVSSPNLKPRPPTARKPLFSLATVLSLEKVSRRIQPRAPPFLS